MKEESTKTWLRFFNPPPGLSYDLSKFSDNFTPFFDFERPLQIPQAKIKKSEANLL